MVALMLPLLKFPEKAKLPFYRSLSSARDVLKSQRCSSDRTTGSVSGSQKDRRNCGSYPMPRGHVSARRQRTGNHLEWLSDSPNVGRRRRG